MKMTANVRFMILRRTRAAERIFSQLNWIWNSFPNEQEDLSIDFCRIEEQVVCNLQIDFSEQNCLAGKLNQRLKLKSQLNGHITAGDQAIIMHYVLLDIYWFENHCMEIEGKSWN